MTLIMTLSLVTQLMVGPGNCLLIRIPCDIHRKGNLLWDKKMLVWNCKWKMYYKENKICLGVEILPFVWHLEEQFLRIQRPMYKMCMDLQLSRRNHSNKPRLQEKCGAKWPPSFSEKTSFWGINKHFEWQNEQKNKNPPQSLKIWGDGLNYELSAKEGSN